jgi:4-hydroxybenzoyl-CoA reductase subunit alpha
VRFVGDPVAAVAATDEDTAPRRRAHRGRVRAAADDRLDRGGARHPEPRIHDYGDGGNVHKAVSLQFGDVDAGFAGADLVLEDTFFYEGNTHLPMEQHATVAVPEDDGRLTVSGRPRRRTTCTARWPRCSGCRRRTSA